MFDPDERGDRPDIEGLSRVGDGGGDTLEDEEEDSIFFDASEGAVIVPVMPSAAPTVAGGTISAYLAYLDNEEWVDRRYPQRCSSPRSATPMMVKARSSSSGKSRKSKKVRARAIPMERGGRCGG